jgi:hypothetical protein
MRKKEDSSDKFWKGYNEVKDGYGFHIKIKRFLPLLVDFCANGMRVM